MKKISLLITVAYIATTLAFLTVSQTVYGHGKEKHGPKGQKGDITYSKDIKPLFEKKCSKCHGAKSLEHMEFVKDIQKYTKKMIGSRMDSYSHMVSFVVWPDTSSLMKALDDGKNTEDDKPGEMYNKLGSLEKERQKKLMIFKQWVGSWTLKEWAEINKDEINKMKLNY
jgi:hypothetical protein